jgi:hypothetical protein
MKNFDKVIEEARSGVMPFYSWELLPKESAEAFAAFVVYRDLGFGRCIRTAIDSVKENNSYSQSYGSWRKWAVDYRWKERAADFDRYNEQLKQTENRKTIEAQAEKHREVTGLMLDVAKKRLQTMKPDDLSSGGVVEFVQTAVKIQNDNALLITPNVKNDNAKLETSFQGEFNFVSDFQGL